MPTRRTLLRAAAWTAPAVTVAVTAPAYAASGPVSGCTPSGHIRTNDNGQGKTYVLNPGCPAATSITNVTIDNVPAIAHGDGTYIAAGFPDARRTRMVVINTTTGDWTGPVTFNNENAL